MAPAGITAVTGPPGAGKTTWICQQLAQASATGLYLCLTNDMSIDRTYIATEFPQVQILVAEKRFQLPSQLNSGDRAYIELGFHLDLATISQLLDTSNCHRIAIVPPGSADSEWHDWADEIVIGVPAQTVVASPQLWRSPLQGNVLDFNSLEVFWYELIQGAYGKATRAKGIFDITDGQSIYGDFVMSLPPRDFAPLNLSRWLEGRPQRFSGLEVWGQNLDEAAIAQTLKDCCLSSAEIHYYQQQIQQLLLEEARK
jgi:hypothetical protein